MVSFFSAQIELLKQINYELLMHLVTDAAVPKNILLPHSVPENEYASYTDEDKIQMIRYIKSFAHTLEKN